MPITPDRSANKSSVADPIVESLSSGHTVARIQATRRPVRWNAATAVLAPFASAPSVQQNLLKTLQDEHDWNALSGMDRSEPVSVANIHSPIASPDGMGVGQLVTVPQAQAVSSSVSGSSHQTVPSGSPTVVRSRAVVQLPKEETDASSGGPRREHSTPSATTTPPQHHSAVTPPALAITSITSSSTSNTPSLGGATVTKKTRSLFTEKTKDDTWALAVTLYVLLVGSSPMKQRVRRATIIFKKCIMRNFRTSCYRPRSCATIL